jgi:archaeal type IV pilus assembly protein PilA
MGSIKKFKKNEPAVSPVVGVMLMLVVTIIIAAVVSAFSGGITTSQKKVPQATIKGEFSVSDGMTIQHMGGDPLALKDTVFTIWDGPTFGEDAEEITKQTLDLKNMTDADGNPVIFSDGTYNISSFKAGSYLTISADKCSCDLLQPSIAPSGVDGATYTGTATKRFGLCIRNAANIGNKFVLAVSDKNGNLISQAEVTVKG